MRYIGSTGFEYVIIERIDESEGNDQVLHTMMAYCTSFTSKNGENIDRPKLQRMLSELQVCDVEIVQEISLVFRSVKELLTTVESIKEIGASLKSQNESWLDTSSENPKNQFLLISMAA